ncbi:amidohydrolase family protein [Falsiroseomonas sp. E2-1-a20]|uniref:amidohydrolase family protein n=1 Tax=Falsiroseomonas sp. E2-1-a20 TaxID=3239300 RepID=UPI003F34F646
MTGGAQLRATTPFSAGGLPALLQAPAGAADCHFHIYDSRFPYNPTAALRPAEATVADYRRLQARIGTTRCVVVQPSTYGTDNRCLLDALRQLGPAARGIAVVAQDITDESLRSLDRLGVRGIRFNLARTGGTSPADMEVLARRVAPLGWHVQVHTLGDHYPDLVQVLQSLPLPVVIDHMGRLPQPAGLDHPAWPALRRLVDGRRCWVKLSGAYHDTSTGAPTYEDSGRIARAWIDAAPERMVWGTDWPHPSATSGEKPLPDDAELFDRLGDWAPTEALRYAILVANPATLYGFAA